MMKAKKFLENHEHGKYHTSDWDRDMLCEIMEAYAEKQIKELKHQKFLTEKKLIECSNKWWKQEDKIKELKEQIDELIIINQDLHNLNTCTSCKKLKVVLD